MMKRPHLYTVLAIVAVLIGMAGLAGYSVTLYRLFCQVTGAGGTTQRASIAPDARGRVITVLFDTTTAPNLPWRFVPLQRRVRLRLGEETIAYFAAENLSDHDIVGHAAFNVTPEKTGLYFKKIQCFCFDEQLLHAHQKVAMPVTFFVDPQLAADPNTEEVEEITLAYTFFRSVRPDQGHDLTRLNVGQSPAVRGEALFGAQCAGCHALAETKIGPRLGGVYGRHAGGLAGYPYSQGLRRAQIVWDSTSLNTWLAGPGDMVAGAAMPMRVRDAADRAAIIAYLRTLPGTP